MIHPDRKKFQFPWRRGNRFELLVDGRSYFPPMLESIERAQRHVLLEIYLFESGAVASRFIDALTRAAARGVRVKVLVDDFGAAKLAHHDRERLTAAGVDLLCYNPVHLRKWFGNMFRDHRKLLIVDGELAFVSGTGITNEFDDPKRPARSWRETAVRASGPVLADWQEGRARGVIGSPHFFVGDESWFCPSLDIRRVDGRLLIRSDPGAFATFIEHCLSA